MDAEDKEALVRLAAESMQLELTGKVVGNMAHMVNNALTRVLGYVQLMAVEQSEVQRAHYMEQLSLGERETSAAARELLDFARRLRAPRGAVDINDIIASVRGLLERSCQQQDVLLIEDYDQAITAIEGRPGQLQLLVLHLIFNCLEAFARVGSGGVIQVRTVALAGKVRIEIEDDGPGLDAVTLARVFALGYSTKEGGAGLGLPACRAIAEAHGGYVLLSSGQEGVCAVVELGP